MDPHFVAEPERGERALGLRTASGSTLGGARTQVRARTTRERGLSWQCNLSTTNAMYGSFGLVSLFLIFRFG